jgi:hypothetical protein
VEKKKVEKLKDSAAALIETPKGPLLYWKRYYAHDSDISKLSNTFLLNIYFVQTMRQILSGMFPLGRVDAKNFGALQLQVHHSVSISFIEVSCVFPFFIL